MNTTPLRFISVGFGNAVCLNRVIAITLPHSAAGKRRAKQARETGAYIDMTFGRSLKSL